MQRNPAWGQVDQGLSKNSTILFNYAPGYEKLKVIIPLAPVAVALVFWKMYRQKVVVGPLLLISYCYEQNFPEFMYILLNLI